MFRLRSLRCSFCRKPENEVAKLVAGPHVYICDSCVSIATRLMKDEPMSDRQTPAVRLTLLPKLWKHVKDFIHPNVLRAQSWT